MLYAILGLLFLNFYFLICGGSNIMDALRTINDSLKEIKDKLDKEEEDDFMTSETDENGVPY